MTTDLYAHALWTVRIVAALVALAAALALVNMVHRQVASTGAQVSVNTSIDTCDAKNRVAYVRRLQSSVGNCDAVVMHVANSTYAR